MTATRLTLPFLLIAAVVLFAWQTPEGVVARVIDGQTRAPIANAIVTPEGREVRTDASGVVCGILATAIRPVI